MHKHAINFVQSYRYAETRYTAEAQHEKAAKAAAMAAKHSVENLYNVEHVEKQFIAIYSNFNANYIYVFFFSLYGTWEALDSIKMMPYS